MHHVQLAARAARLRPLGFDLAPTLPRLPRIATPFARDVIAGFSRPQKSIPGNWLYDTRGCELLDEIAQADSASSRTEVALLEGSVAHIAALAGPGVILVELGCGAGGKTPILLAALEAPNAAVSVQPCAERLIAESLTLRAMFPKLAVHSLQRDMAEPGSMAPLQRSANALRRAAQSSRPWGRRLGFMPGGVIGQFAPHAATALLERLAQALGEDALLVVGVNAALDRAALMLQRDDRDGLRAEFNKNLLARINRELDGDLDAPAFRHETRFNAELQRVEMHLVCNSWETFEVLGRRFGFCAHESILTETRCAFSRSRFEALARRAGWSPVQYWTDANARFALHVLSRS